jgi:putative NIF3 family GTP cyclohydrolase 1 type 2
MNVQAIFDTAIELGIRNDFRSKKTIQDRLRLAKKHYEALSPKEKPYFDKERIMHPYADCAVHHIAHPKKPIKRVLAGIDIDPAEILAAIEISRKNPKKPIDLVIAHHPLGKALAGLDSVMDLQVDIFEQYGIPVAIAEGLTHKRISEVSRGINPINHYQTVDLARLLDVSLINTHTTADNMVATFLKDFFEKKQPQLVGEILDMLMEIPEYQEASRQGVPPRLFSGSKDRRTGRIAISEITGGTEGSAEMYEHIARAGIGTIISMHQSEKHREAAEKAHVNVIIAGHMSSDSIGMNLFLDVLEKKGIEIIPCSGLIRYSRNKK